MVYLKCHSSSQYYRTRKYVYIVVKKTCIKISRAHFHQDILVIETTISGFLSDKSRRYILNKAKSITALQFNQLMCLLMLLSHGIFYIFFLTYYFSFGEIIKAGHFKKPHYCRHLSHLMRKPTICICENKGADQLRGNREADQRLCFRYSDSTIPPLLNSKISSF